MKSLSNYMDTLVAQDAIGPVDRMTIQDQVIDSLVEAIERMPSFNQKSSYEVGARDMKKAIVRELLGMKS